jgi:hypothetical protein
LLEGVEPMSLYFSSQFLSIALEEFFGFVYSTGAANCCVTTQYPKISTWPFDRR